MTHFRGEHIATLYLWKTFTESNTFSTTGVLPGSYNTQELPCSIRVAANP